MFIKKGNTNWTHIVIVALIAGAAGGGLVVYINDTVNETGLLLSSSVLTNSNRTDEGKKEVLTQAVAIKDVLGFANNHLNDTPDSRVQTQGTIAAIDYTSSAASIVITDNEGNYILAVVSHADMTAANSPYPKILSLLQKNEIIGVSGTVSFTEPGIWSESEKTKLGAANFPKQIGMISVDGLQPAAK
jgi:lysyl-tRNA synthetase class II